MGFLDFIESGWGKFTTGIGNAVSSIKNGIVGGYHSMAGAGSTIVNTVGGAIGGVTTKIGDVVSTVYSDVKSFGHEGLGVVNGVLQRGSHSLDNLVDKAGSTITGLGSELSMPLTVGLIGGVGLLGFMMLNKK